MPNRNYKELFQPIPLESVERQTLRPADSLSNFVVEVLPEMLNQVRAGQLDISIITEHAESLAASQLLKIDRLSDQNQAEDLLVTRLDVLMLDAAISKSQGIPGPILSELVYKIAKLTRRPAGLTYEDVVINNPENDIRTFSNGLMGKSEADFYNGHRYIEDALEPAVGTLMGILSHSDQLDTETITELLKIVHESLQTTIAYTGIIAKKMPTEHFRGGFRMYLGELQNRQLRGPSGAFTARIPLIEYLLMGETISDEDFQYQLNELQYFPLTHQQILIDALVSAKNGISVRQLLIERESSEEGMQVIQELSLIFKRFREVHLKAVETHLPEVFAGNEKGTGGESEVVKFLDDRKNRDHGFDSNTV